MSAENWRTAWCGKPTHCVLEVWAAASSPLNSERGRHGLCPHRSFDLAEELDKQRAKPLDAVSYHFSPYLPPPQPVILASPWLFINAKCALRLLRPLSRMLSPLIFSCLVLPVSFGSLLRGHFSQKASPTCLSKISFLLLSRS